MLRWFAYSNVIEQFTGKVERNHTGSVYTTASMLDSKRRYLERTAVGVGGVDEAGSTERFWRALQLQLDAAHSQGLLPVFQELFPPEQKHTGCQVRERQVCAASMSAVSQCTRTNMTTAGYDIVHLFKYF